MHNELSICYFTFSVIVIFLIGIIPQLVKYSPNTILMIVSNPGNKMTSSYKQAFRVMRWRTQEPLSFPPPCHQFPLPGGLRFLAFSFSNTPKESLFTGYIMLQPRSQVLSTMLVQYTIRTELLDCNPVAPPPPPPRSWGRNVWRPSTWGTRKPHLSGQSGILGTRF